MKNITNKVKRPPIIQVVKRTDVKKSVSFFYALLAVGFALAIGAIFLAAMEINSTEFYGIVIEGCFDFDTPNMIMFHGFMRSLMPLIIVSLGLSVAFKIKFWNIGAEGQFIMGALGAVTAGLFFGNNLSHGATILVMLIFAIVFSGVFGLIPALCKIKWNTNETLFTLMLNYIALYMIAILAKQPGYNMVGGRPTDFETLPPSAWIDQISLSGDFMIDCTFILCILLPFILFIYTKYTKHGYEISIIGDSLNTAKYAGMNHKWIIVRTVFLSSAIIGVAGMLHVAGESTGHKISSGVTGGVGWTGIIVAWLSNLNPLVIVVVSILMTILKFGSSVAQSALNTPPAISDILQGLVLFSVIAASFFSNYKIVMRDCKFKSTIINPIHGFINKISCSISNFFEPAKIKMNEIKDKVFKTTKPVPVNRLNNKVENDIVNEENDNLEKEEREEE